MMIKILVGDILKSEAQALVNPVNCEGVMGKGVALQFKKRFPDMYKDYVGRCKRKDVCLGVPYIYKTQYPPHVINFPTKDAWRSLSKVEAIRSGLGYLIQHIKDWGIVSIAIPALGCGNGQLEWKVVGPIIFEFAKDMNIEVLPKNWTAA